MSVERGANVRLVVAMMGEDNPHVRSRRSSVEAGEEAELTESIVGGLADKISRSHYNFSTHRACSSRRA
ncbi:hypothetical protein SO694_00002320 [Aureococcus anophagefferens]|uniref:Uncharacterized protein n=1 Tax=Aureococcus anophagefferens TaxID=44056 RepID=A0ABR1GD01_AURAN